MKLYLIKIGKAAKILRKEGFFEGGKRIIMTGIQFINMLKKVRPADILFVAGGTMGDSTLYRVHHQAEELSMKGFKCAIVAQDNPWLLSYPDKFKIFILHRTLHTAKMAEFVEKIKKQKKEIIFETDDLVFDPEHLKGMEFYKKMNKLERILYKRDVGGEILNDPYVKACTTTTSYLADVMRKKGKKVFITTNKLSNKDLEIADRILKSKDLQTANNKPQAVRIGYLSGTFSHNKDFATITDALMEIMEKYREVKLYLMGPLDIESKLNKFKDNIEQMPRVARDKYFRNISELDINLAPLELGNPFCEAKSELKFFEPGILGIPTVAVANQTFSEAISDGVDGFLAGNTEEWVEKLDKLIIDENLRREMGQKAREKSLRDYTNKNSHNKEYYDYLREKIGK